MLRPILSFVAVLTWCLGRPDLAHAQSPFGGPLAVSLPLMGEGASRFFSVEPPQLEPVSAPGASTDDGRFAATMMVAGMFSALGAMGGLALGADGGDQWGPALVGFFGGAWAGAGIGGAVASGRPGAAFAGSAAGLLPAALVLFAGQGSPPSFVLAPLVHGLITAAAAR